MGREGRGDPRRVKFHKGDRVTVISSMFMRPGSIGTVIGQAGFGQWRVRLDNGNEHYFFPKDIKLNVIEMLARLE